MVDANINIIGELKLFLDTVVNDQEVRSLFTSGANDFSRNRKLPLSRLVGLIINMPKRSLSIEIQEFFEGLGLDYSQSCGKAAFCLQRSKLAPEFFKIWNDWLVKSFYHYYGSRVKRWKGFLLQAVDGSTAYLINRGDVVDYFGTRGNKYCDVPMARVMQIHDILNGLTVWGDIYPNKMSERSIMNSRVERLAEDSLSIFDRGYPSFTLMYLLENQETRRHFVMRCRADFNKEVIEFVKSGDNNRTLELSPGYKAIVSLRKHGYIVNQATTLKIRMAKVVLSTGETEILLTNLYDEETYNLSELKQLYGMRWAIETAYGQQKNQQQMEQFSGHRVICIQQDYAAGIFISNLQSLIEKQCEPYLERKSKSRKHQQKINRNISWAALKGKIVMLFLHNHPKEILLQLQNEFERYIEPQRPGRHNPRNIKMQRLTGKYQTLTNYKRAI